MMMNHLLSVATLIHLVPWRRCSLAVVLLLVTSPGVLGQTYEHEPVNPDQLASVSWPTVTLNPVTLGDQLAWSFQALVAPDRLEEGVPLYAYTLHDALNILEHGDVADAGMDQGWYVGTAVLRGDQWEAYPVLAQGRTLAEIWQSLNHQSGVTASSLMSDARVTSAEAKSGDAVSYLVSNRPLVGLNIEEKLWISRTHWLNALSAASAEEL